MLDYKDIIKRRYLMGLSGRAIAVQLGASKSGVYDFLNAFEKCDRLSYPLPEGITNYGIHELVFVVSPISSIPFLSVIYKRCHWDENKSYLVYGREYKKNRLVDFDLETAREIAPEDFLDPEAV